MEEERLLNIKIFGDNYFVSVEDIEHEDGTAIGGVCNKNDEELLKTIIGVFEKVFANKMTLEAFKNKIK